jgi:hypothetical protein
MQGKKNKKRSVYRVCVCFVFVLGALCSGSEVESSDRHNLRLGEAIDWASAQSNLALLRLSSG